MGECMIVHRSRGKFPKFTYLVNGVDRAYDPDYAEWVEDGDGNWRIKLKVSGTLTFKQLNNARKGIDVFLVGGGAGGACSCSGNGNFGALAGGGSGYTRTEKNISVKRRQSYAITVGVGGEGKSQPAVNEGGAYSIAGSASSAFGFTANGGGRAHAYFRYNDGVGQAEAGDGGSGAYAAAAVIVSWYNGHAGATNGGSMNSRGQGTTTREFGETSGALYAQGGGSGGGTPYIKNSGNGGNGGHNGSVYITTNGCDGIVIIRNHRE